MPIKPRIGKFDTSLFYEVFCKDVVCSGVRSKKFDLGMKMCKRVKISLRPLCRISLEKSMRKTGLPFLILLKNLKNFSPGLLTRHEIWKSTMG